MSVPFSTRYGNLRLHQVGSSAPTGLTKNSCRLDERPNTNGRRSPINNMSIFKKSKRKTPAPDVWARPEMSVTFRTEIMPGRSHEERTFRIKLVFPNGRVTLHDFAGEHRQAAFEPIVFDGRPGK